MLYSSNETCIAIFNLVLFSCQTDAILAQVSSVRRQITDAGAKCNSPRFVFNISAPDLTCLIPLCQIYKKTAYKIFYSPMMA